jgi:hypothetical protein
MPQSGPGQIVLWCDFAQEDNIANTAESRLIGDFTVGGQGNAETDSGIPTLNADALGGVGVLTTTDEVDHTIAVGTPIMFDVDLMGPIIAEARVRFGDLDTKEVFFGFTDIDINTVSVQTDICHGASTTVTLTASDICGFLLSAELTDDEDWHTVYNGGTSSGVTASGSLDADDDAVAGEWQVLKMEIFPNGTVSFYIDEALIRTVTGAVSTSVDLNCMLALEAKTAAIETLDVDYLMVTAQRDWTV